MSPIIGFVLLAGVTAARVQQPLSTSPFPSGETNEYQFKWPIQKVAIIGAGPSGLVAYRELTEAGLDVRVFERDSVPGGNWHYTEEFPLDAPVPNVPCAIGDFVPSLPPANISIPYSENFEDDGELRRDHRGPKPVWESLTSNIPSLVQKFPRFPWPADTQWELSHYQVRNYVRSYASYLNINSNDANPAAAYNTRVEHVEKRINKAGQEQGWRLWLKSLKPIQHSIYQATWWTEDFDAVVVATGRFSAPSMPSIPGLDEWVQRFPDLLRHSRQYRRPEAYVNQTVLIIGAALSGAEISKDLNRHAGKVYQSVRPTNDSVARAKLKQSRRRIPNNTTFIGEIKQFLPIPEGLPIQSGRVELRNGTILSGIDSGIFATGFRNSFPFLSQYYDGAVHEPRVGSAMQVSPFLPSDGSHIRDLYLDVFYTWDPTLAFISITSGPNQVLVLADYTALALAKVWTGTAKLPNSQRMQALYEETVKERGGYGKYASYLSPEQYKALIRYLTGWLNEAAARYGGKQIDGFPKSYDEVLHYWHIARFGEMDQQVESEDAELSSSLGFDLGRGADQRNHDGVWFYDDEW